MSGRSGRAQHHISIYRRREMVESGVYVPHWERNKDAVAYNIAMQYRQLQKVCAFVYEML